ncbi:hypothetical protein CLV36_11545 [Laceyella sediminis]|uniref:YolD-like protein n=1 Tax=Laceyella sediminis TaxID=573074 RepID=A0ABX5EKC0_9BACL|nr:hypothetical protein [Laceyella sediminis]PRZ12280.1 hypothetical protein CLV36_11545 [Laceyella sediminis]
MGSFMQERQERLREEVQSRKLMRVAPVGREKSDVEWSLKQLGMDCMWEKSETRAHTVSVYGELARQTGRMVVIYDKHNRVSECHAFHPCHVDEIEWVKRS